MNAVAGYVLSRLREPSTWSGIAALLASTANTFPPPYGPLIGLGAATISGTVAILAPDRSAALAKKMDQ